MISILPLRDREQLEQLNKAAKTSCGFAFCLWDGGQIAGSLLYDVDLQAGEALLCAADAADDNSLDGLVRAVFSSLLDAHVQKARFGEAIGREPLLRLGFIQTAGEAEQGVLIEDILYHCKHCKKD